MLFICHTDNDIYLLTYPYSSLRPQNFNCNYKLQTDFLEQEVEVAEDDEGEESFQVIIFERLWGM